MTSEYWALANANDVARSKNNGGTLTDVDESNVDEHNVDQNDVAEEEDDWHEEDQPKLHFYRKCTTIMKASGERAS